MKRSDLIRTIQVQFKNMRGEDAAAMLDLICNRLIADVAAGNRAEIRGFGTFQSRVRAAKTGYDPRTGAAMPMSAGRTILFRPSRELTKKMN
ncbi:MAG: integration host factor subunit beta [Rickettsiales bacterium]|jgi:integration host factor subunit beta|nr:integration host factor subunit beta [Rickettsiales bacterium]